MRTKNKKKYRRDKWVCERYTLPTLCTRKNDITKPWFVWFRWKFPETGKVHPYPIQFKGGINEYHRLDQRKAEGNAFREHVQDKLEQGWNPFTDTYDYKDVADDVSELTRLGFCEALRFALEKKTLKPKSFSAYETAVNLICEAAGRVHYDRIHISKIKRAHLKSIFNNWQKFTSASDKTYNKYLGFIKALFTELLEWEAIESSVIHPIRNKKVIGQKPFRQPEVNEKQPIKDYLEMVNPNFLTYVLSIYHTGARPDELLSIKVEDVKIQSRIIEFAPDITKPDQMKRIPITNELYDRIQKLDLENAKKEWYLFGSPYPSGIGFRGNGCHKKPMFCPNPTKVKRDTATRLWKKYIKDGLGINADMYGLKHRGGNDKINAQVGLDAVQMLYGHATKDMTKRYAFEVNNQLFNEIVNQSPDF